MSKFIIGAKVGSNPCEIVCGGPICGGGDPCNEDGTSKSGLPVYDDNGFYICGPGYDPTNCPSLPFQAARVQTGYMPNQAEPYGFMTVLGRHINDPTYGPSGIQTNLVVGTWYNLGVANILSAAGDYCIIKRQYFEDRFRTDRAGGYFIDLEYRVHLTKTGFPTILVPLPDFTMNLSTQSTVEIVSKMLKVNDPGYTLAVQGRVTDWSLPTDRPPDIAPLTIGSTYCQVGGSYGYRWTGSHGILNPP